MTRYRVPVADPLAADAAVNEVEGLRLVSVDGPWLKHPSVIICTFEDDNAPAELEGQLVELLFHRDDNGTVTVIDRQVIAG